MNNVIEVSNLSYTYHGNDSPTINNVSFAIKENSWVTVVGSNGSGKSTLSKLLNGLLVADKDPETVIKINNQVITIKNSWNARNEIGIIFQNPDNQFVGATVNDDVAFGLENRNISRKKMLKVIPRVLSEVEMSKFYSSEPHFLSGGQKQRVAIAGILAVQPKIIILDESTSMLDVEGKNKILNLLKDIKKENNITVLSITHDLNEMAEADQVLVLDQGKVIAQDAPQKIFNNHNIISKAKLEIPFIYQMKHLLKTKGIFVPDNIKNEEMLVKFLCQ